MTIHIDICMYVYAYVYIYMEGRKEGSKEESSRQPPTPFPTQHLGAYIIMCMYMSHSLKGGYIGDYIGFRG